MDSRRFKRRSSFSLAAEDFYLGTISSRRNGLGSRLLRPLLSLLSAVYWIIITIRNLRYDRAAEIKTDRVGRNGGWIKQASIPVVSVGNLTTGGTGKTPMVVWLAKVIEGLGQRVVIVSRGYGAPTSAGQNDETLEILARLPEVRCLTNKCRYSAIETAVRDFDSEVAILDDGFQHRRLARDLNVVLIDGTQPFGYDRLLPRGLLREPISSLKRADVIAITRCELIDEATEHALVERLQKVQPQALIVKSSTRPEGWMSTEPQIYPLSHLGQKPMFAFCGIGNPENFLASLERIGGKLVGHRFFPDHHAYQPDDLRQLNAAANLAKAEVLVCTHKDMVKLTQLTHDGLPVFALVIETTIISNRELLVQRISALLPAVQDN